MIRSNRKAKIHDSSPADATMGRNRTFRSGQGTSLAWPYIFWTVVSLLVLTLVINYDQRSSADGLYHLAEGRRLEKYGQADNAMAEYRLALRNPRLSNNLRAEAAVLLADLHLRERGDSNAALDLLNEARKLSYRSSDRLNVPNRIQALQAKSGRIQRKPGELGQSRNWEGGVLISPHPEETSGPVIATLSSGRTLRLGYLLATLRQSGRLSDPEFAESPDQLEKALLNLILEETAVDRAVAQGAHLDPDLIQKVWSVYRALVRAEGGRLARPQPDDEETSAAVAQLYAQRRHLYSRPGSLTVLAIYTTSSATADQAQRELRDGRSFESVARTHSVHQPSAASGGYLGPITDDQTTLPILGQQPEVLAKLRELPLLTITQPAQVDNYWVIFQVRSRQTGYSMSLDEARTRLLPEILRKNHPASLPTNLQQLDARVDLKLLGEVWKSLDDGRRSRINNQPKSGTP
jgi:hypothetical protein